MPDRRSGLNASSFSSAYRRPTGARENEVWSIALADIAQADNLLTPWRDTGRFDPRSSTTTRNTETLSDFDGKLLFLTCLNPSPHDVPGGNAEPMEQG